MDKKVTEALERIAVRVEDLFILTAVQGGMSAEKVRETLGVRAERVYKVTRHIKMYGKKD